MITIYVEGFKGEIDQSSYTSIIINVDLHTIECPYCHNYGFKVHGYYYRYVKTRKGKIVLRIERIKCSYCNHTHALMPSLIVPYQSIQLQDQIRIIEDDNVAELMEDNNNINEIDTYRIKHNYNHNFKPRLISFGLVIDENIVTNCFNYFKRQFLQIKCLTNILIT